MQMHDDSGQEKETARLWHDSQDSVSTDGWEKIFKPILYNRRYVMRAVGLDARVT